MNIPFLLFQDNYYKTKGTLTAASATCTRRGIKWCYLNIIRADTQVCPYKYKNIGIFGNNKNLIY
jgi:hypothetical protein